jgi:putative N6-adenine-specific DNA methylase
MGYNAWILSYKEECFEAIGLRPKQTFKLMNGDLECEYRCYELFEGTNKEYKRALKNGENQPDASRWTGDNSRWDDARPPRYDESRASMNRKFAEERIASKRTESFDGSKRGVPKVRNPYDWDDKPLKNFSKEQRKPYDRNRKP